MWEKYDYRELGIVGEPYLDVDFDEVFYLTDTGRRWDGERVSIRDKPNAGMLGCEDVRTKNSLTQSVKGTKRKVERWPRYHTTFDIIKAVEAGRFPDKGFRIKQSQRNPLRSSLT